MSLFGPAPPPKTALGRHRLLSPTAAVRVSPLCLGAMSFGNAWSEFMGTCNKETTFSILDAFYEAGGNFIDTASNYQDEESETWLGEWMAARKNRDEMVIATKFTSLYKKRDPKSNGPMLSNYSGNSAKTLHVSLNASLKKLQTDYIDVLYLHWWDYTTSIPEIMHALDDVVRAGKVLYLGVSDTPAWIVSKANQYARDHGLHPFVVYQGNWNAAMRDFERDIIPMAMDEGMGLVPWGTLASGHFKREGDMDRARKLPGFEVTEAEVRAAKAIEKVADAKGVSLAAVAIAYCMHKTPYVFPVLGCRKVSHLQDNIAALSVELSDADIKAIEDANVFDVGFPQNFLSMPLRRMVESASDIMLLKMAGTFDFVNAPKAIKPSKKE